MSFDFSTLVFDRIQADVEALNDKGTYNATDLNRVTAAMEALDGIFKGLGYQSGYQPVQIHPLPVNPDPGGGGGGDDPHTLLLIHGPDIADASIYQRELTNVGTGQAQVSGSLNDYVLNFNGACRIDLPLGDYFAFGDGDFTVEWREYLAQEPSFGNDPFIFETDPYPFLWYYTNSTINLYCTSQYVHVQIATVELNKWVHCAFVRHGGTLYCFRDGHMVWTGPISQPVTHTPGFVMSVGGRSNQAQYFNGYMEEFRVSDVARWTADFTPPDRPYGVGDVVNITPVMTGPDSPEGYEASASSTQGQQAPWWAFAPEEGAWQSGAGTPQWLQLKFPQAVTVCEFSVENDQALPGITAFTLQGSVDGIQFDTLGEYEGDPTAGRINRFTVPTPARYQYYRLQITGTGHQDGCVVAAVQFFQPRGDYTQLAYIESSGAQYIETAVTPDQDTRVVLDYEPVTTINTILFGSRASLSSSDRFLVIHAENTNSIRTDYGNNNLNTQLRPTQRTVIDKNKNVTTIGEQTFSNPAATFTGQYPMGLFCGNSGGNYNLRSSYRLYACQIYDDGTLARQYVPCRREADGAVGLYDQANGAFCANAGTGSFTAGPAVGDPEPPAPPPEPELDPYTWYEEDIPSQAQMEQYLSNVERMGRTLAGQADMSGLPVTMEHLTWQEANAIEQLLYQLQAVIQVMQTTFVACGPATCGGDYL